MARRFSKCKKYMARFKDNQYIIDAEIIDRETGVVYKSMRDKEIQGDILTIHEHHIFSYVGYGGKQVNYAHKYCQMSFGDFKPCEVNITKNEWAEPTKTYTAIFRK